MSDELPLAVPETFGVPIQQPRHAFDQVGAYALGERLAQGGGSVVYRAVDSRDQSAAAVKVLARRGDSPALVPDIEFIREVHLAERVRHPHLSRIRDSGWADGRGWIAYELARQGSLQDRIGYAGHLDAAEVRRVAREVGAALAAVHAVGLVHRDVKPSNVLIDAGRYMLGDFGAAKRMDAEGTTTLVGSVPYMAPEQVQGTVSPATDVYCLGATLYRVWTGLNPPPLAQRRPDWPPHTKDDLPLRRLIETMLDPRPDRRPALHDVGSMLVQRRWTRMPWPLGIVGIAVLALPLAWLLPWGRDDTPVVESTPTQEVTAVGSSLGAPAFDAPASLAALAADVATPVTLPYPEGRLVMAEDDPHTDWGPNPVYYLHRGIRYHVVSAEVLQGQIEFFVDRAEGPLGWVSAPECCRPYAQLAELPEGPELVAADARSEGLLIRRAGDDETWIVTGGVRMLATDALVAASNSSQILADAVLLAPAVFDAIPIAGEDAIPIAGEEAPAQTTSTEPPCLVAGGEIVRLHEQHREGLGASLACEQPLPDGGAYARWEHGTIWWAPGVGARLTGFSIDAEYRAQGGAAGWLGYPLSEEVAEPTGNWERMVTFQHGVIVWAAGRGAESMPSWAYVQRTAPPRDMPILRCEEASFALELVDILSASEVLPPGDDLLAYEFALPSGLLYPGMMLGHNAVRTPWIDFAGWARRDTTVIIIVPPGTVPGAYPFTLTMPDGQCGEGVITVDPAA